jgi:hypothetical protein
MRLELGLGNFQSGITRRSQPSIDRDAHLSNRRFARVAKSRA